MSGHSHWHSIKHDKALADAKKGKAFSKLARLITIAVREAGGDPITNAKLRLAIEKARTINMPKDNVERAIKRGSGKLEEERLEEVIFEAYGPGGTALIIEGISENKNRALGEIKQTLNEHGGKLVGEGAVRWMFERKGVIHLNLKTQQGDLQNREQLELLVIEAGADDMVWATELLEVYTKPEKLEEVKRNLERKGIKIESSSLDWVAKESLQVNEKDQQANEQLFEALDENEAVQEIYSNVK